MSEAKKERTIESVHQEYSRLCSQAGHVQYQISVLSKDLETLNVQLRELNAEAFALQAKAAESVAPPSETL